MTGDAQSFFHGIQSMFTADYHGRYLALILNAVGKHNPECLVDFFSKVTGMPKRMLGAPRFEVEYEFRGSAGHRRRADLAVFSNLDDQVPVLLVEIKYFDKPIAELGAKPAQLSDYAAWVNAKSSERFFVAICREHVDLKVGKSVRWGALAAHLTQYAYSSDLVQLLVDYLQQEGITVQNIDDKSLLNYFKSLLCPPLGSGVLANNTQGPTEFGKLQMNVKYMAGAFDPLFKHAWKGAGEALDGTKLSSRTATIGFDCWQHLKTTDPQKLFNGQDAYLVNLQRDGGIVSIYARYSLGHGNADWLRVAFGFAVHVESHSKTVVENRPKAYAFAEITGAKLQALGSQMYFEKKISYADISIKAKTSHDRLERYIRDLLGTAVESLLSQKKVKLLPRQTSAITRLRKPLLTQP